MTWSCATAIAGSVVVTLASCRIWIVRGHRESPRIIKIRCGHSHAQELTRIFESYTNVVGVFIEQKNAEKRHKPHREDRYQCDALLNLHGLPLLACCIGDHGIPTGQRR